MGCCGGVLGWEQLAADQNDPWLVVPVEVFAQGSLALVSAALGALDPVSCHRITGVHKF